MLPSILEVLICVVDRSEVRCVRRVELVPLGTNRLVVFVAVLIEVEGRRSGLLRVPNSELPPTRALEVVRNELVFPVRGRVDLVSEEPCNAIDGLLAVAELPSASPVVVKLVLLAVPVRFFEKVPGLLLRSDRRLVCERRSSLLVSLGSVPKEEELELFKVAGLVLTKLGFVMRLCLVTKLGFLTMLGLVTMLEVLDLVMSKLGSLLKVDLLSNLELFERLDLVTREEESVLEAVEPWLVSFELEA